MAASDEKLTLSWLPGHRRYDHFRGWEVHKKCFAVVMFIVSLLDGHITCMDSLRFEFCISAQDPYVYPTLHLFSGALDPAHQQSQLLELWTKSRSREVRRLAS